MSAVMVCLKVIQCTSEWAFGACQHHSLAAVVYACSRSIFNGDDLPFWSMCGIMYALWLCALSIWFVNATPPVTDNGQQLIADFTSWDETNSMVQRLSGPRLETLKRMSNERLQFLRYRSQNFKKTADMLMLAQAGWRRAIMGDRSDE